MTALDACHAARRAWEQSSPQTFIDFDALTERAVGALDRGRPVPTHSSQAARSVNAFTPSPPGWDRIPSPVMREHQLDGTGAAGGEHPLGREPHESASSSSPRDVSFPADHHGGVPAETPFLKNTTAPQGNSRPGITALRGS